MTKTLQWIVVILLLAVVMSGNVLVKEIEKSIPELDYTIYDIPVESKESHTRIYEPIPLTEFVFMLKEDQKEYKYKFYKKFKLMYFCECDECTRKWTWGDPPRGVIWRPKYSVAANPKSLALGTHLQIDGEHYLVFKVDEEIPEKEIYVYVEQHNRKLDGLICDVYKAKP